MRVTERVRGMLPWFLRRGGGACDHLVEGARVGPPSAECVDCLALGDTWVHLRQCLTCGSTGCCDQSKNKHATAHFHATGHPVVRSAQPGESWRWCYVDGRMVG